MYMRFQLQYLNPKTNRWADLAAAAPRTGSRSARRRRSGQAGTSFELKPVAGRPAVTLRGVITFQWRLGTTVVASASRPTTAGRVSLAGSDPAGYSAASCVIG